MNRNLFSSKHFKTEKKSQTIFYFNAYFASHIFWLKMEFFTFNNVFLKPKHKICTERLFVRVNDKIEWKFSITLFWNGKSRGFITLIHIMASKFSIVLTVFKTSRKKINILNTKYYESSFKNFRVRKNDIMITVVSKNSSNKSNNEYYIHDIHYCASNGKSVAANQYWRSTEFFVNVVTIRIDPTGILKLT